MDSYASLIWNPFMGPMVQGRLEIMDLLGADLWNLENIL